MENLENTPIDITPEDSVVPIYLIPSTPEEEQERAALVLEEEKRKEAELLRTSSRESALAKLAKLGLTEDEVKAVLGL